ncbi:MAG: hypothetical protein DRG40_07235 [Deltaproteobacteria bacterium]|nr:MAG: hypothetical protein DRG40_07235 [Deltaproteobacteria bacterium]
MANKLPNALKRREILYGKETPPQVLIEYGDLYMEAGRLNDAVEFYGRAQHREGLLRLKERALKEGDYFLFSQVAEFLSEDPSPEEWRELARAAMEKGRYQFALKAFHRAGDNEEAQRVRERIKKEFEEGR